MASAQIANITGYRILDSRGVPTVRVEVVLTSGEVGVAAVPSGASTGARESVEIRDHTARYGGRDIQTVLNNIEREVAPGLIGRDVRRQQDIDRWLIERDGTPNKSRWGANTILGVSLAVAQAAAQAAGEPLYRLWLAGQAGELPTPQFNVVNGGAHADNKLAVQEFLLIPGGAPTVAEAIRMGSESYQALKAELRQRGFRTAVGDEGGFAPGISHPEEIFELLLRAIERAGLAAGRDVALGIDVAANSLWQAGRYHWEDGVVDYASLIASYAKWVRDYPLISIEDGLAEDDWEGWAALTRTLGGSCQIVGDDIFVTHANLVERGIRERSANAVLIKLNQVGTVTETRDVLNLAQTAGWNTVVSHRSGETDDTAMVDLAVAHRAGQIKAGAPQRGERTAKYNRLLLIEAKDPRLPFAGWRGLPSRPERG
ncbi:MAG: phosphopyruvate hydratase [Thermaerobacter sp.]|nr:phosphopyruvate hydratase [Thermaerobacter sp.]